MKTTRKLILIFLVFVLFYAVFFHTKTGFYEGIDDTVTVAFVQEDDFNAIVGELSTDMDNLMNVIMPLPGSDEYSGQYNTDIITLSNKIKKLNNNVADLVAVTTGMSDRMAFTEKSDMNNQIQDILDNIDSHIEGPDPYSGQYKDDMMSIQNLSQIIQKDITNMYDLIEKQREAEAQAEAKTKF